MSDTKPKPQPKSLAVGAALTALVAMGQVSMSMYTPSMPAIARAFEASTQDVNLTFTVFLAAFAMAQLIYGPLSDRYGRRRVLMGGIVFYILTSALCMLAPSLEWLIAGRFFQALGACSGPIVGRAMVRDIYGGRGAAKAMAYIGLAFSVSPALTPVIGGFMQAWFGWQANFAVLAIFGVFLLLTVWFMVPETHDTKGVRIDVRKMAANYRLLLCDPIVMGHILCVSLVFGGLMTFVAVAPFIFMNGMGLAPEVYGTLPAMSVIGMVIGNLMVGRYTLRIGLERMQGAGLLAAVAASAMMCGFALSGVVGIAVIIAPFGVFLFGVGLIFPNAMAGAMAPHPQAAGAASALIGFFQIGAGAIAGRIAGLLPQTDQLPMAWMMVGLTLSALVVFVSLVWPNRPKEIRS